MRYAFVARERAHFPNEVLCRLLGVARSGFHDYTRRQANPGSDPDVAVRQDLRRCHRASRGTYGRPRLVKDLRDLGHTVGPKRVGRLMREEGLRGKAKGRVKPRTTDSGHARPVAANRLARRLGLAARWPRGSATSRTSKRAKAANHLHQPTLYGVCSDGAGSIRPEGGPPTTLISLPQPAAPTTRWHPNAGNRPPAPPARLAPD